MQQKPSEADLAAVRRLMGSRTLKRVGVGVEDGTVWYVEQRVDTVKGGTYTYCPCPGWKSKSTPKACSHTVQAEDWWNRKGMYNP